MTRFRNRWLALFGGVALIALSMSSALGAKPGENRGLQVAAFVHSLGADVEESDEETEAEEDTEVAGEDGDASNHGQCVALVAQDSEAVGPPNDNHGGAVSEAARVTCWEEDSVEGFVSDGSEDDEAEADEETEADEESEADEEADDDSDDSDEDESDADDEESDGSDDDEGHGNGHQDDDSDD